MQLNRFKKLLCESARAYADLNGIPVENSWATAIIFENVADNFCPESYKAIAKSADWLQRTRKSHSRIPGILEMQSSNSSDALLKSVFCHPRFSSWKGIADLLGSVPTSPLFGLKARVEKEGTAGDETETTWPSVTVSWRPNSPKKASPRRPSTRF